MYDSNSATDSRALPPAIRNFMRRQRLKVAVVALVATLMVVHPGLAQNLVANGGFDSEPDEWTLVTGGTFSRNALLDVDGNPDSGAGRLENLWDHDDDGTYAVQCIPGGIEPGEAYTLSAWIRFDGSDPQTATGEAWLELAFLSGSGCSGDWLAGHDSSLVLSSSADEWLESRLQSVTAPAGAASAIVFLWTWKYEGSGVVTASFDNVAMSPLESIFTDGFESGDLVQWTTGLE